VVERILLRSLSDMTLANAERLAFDGARIELCDEAKANIARGRARFEAYMGTTGGYVYGSTTAPGSRGKVMLSERESRRQGATLRDFIALKPGPGGEMLPARCVRLAVFARLSNAMTGCGKLRPDTAEAVADLLDALPPVPMQAVACSGEVMPLTWLMEPLAELPLAMGEAMALINGSPFATAMACDVALTAGRRVRLAEQMFALSIEAAQCPAGHFDRRLADRWLDPCYGQSLDRIGALLRGSARTQLEHQAPTSWRVLPNVLAHALQALAEVSRSAQVGLQSLKDNPTFLQNAANSGEDAVVSSGGYHDHRAAKAIDQINSALTDLCVLASRQVAHLLDGAGLGLPPLLARTGDGVGLHDPAGNQSDIASLGFIAYGKHRMLARAFDACFASLGMTAALALEFRDVPLPHALRALGERLANAVRSSPRRIDVVGEPLRQFRTLLRASAEEMTCTDFTAFIPNVE